VAPAVEVVLVMTVAAEAAALAGMEAKVEMAQLQLQILGNLLVGLMAQQLGQVEVEEHIPLLEELETAEVVMEDLDKTIQLVEVEVVLLYLVRLLHKMAATVMD
jgi:hypothetical protein